jgi:activator of HSP90 ATPase
MCKTIKQKVKFKLPPQEIYEILVDEKKHRMLTGQKAEISKKVGGAFSTGAGYANGVNVDLVPGKRIVQAWRGSDFPRGVFSMVSLNLDPTRDLGTELTLIHRGVPRELIPKIEKRWKELYWSNIKKAEKRPEK